MTTTLDGNIICPVPAVYTTPAKLRPVELWRLPIPGGADAYAYAVLAPTADTCAVV